MFKLYALYKEVHRSIDGHDAQEYKGVSDIFSPLMLRLQPIDHQCSGRYTLLTHFISLMESY